MLKKIILRPGREASVRRHHPWVFQGAVQTVDPAVGPGETVDILTADGQWLASGAYSPHSQISARIWSFQQGEEVDASFFRRSLEQAIKARNSLHLQERTSAYRWVNAESDKLPGLIVDRYGDFLVCQVLFAGVERWRQQIVEQLQALLPAAGIYERSEGDSRRKEGLKECCGLLAGADPPDLVPIHEGGLKFLVDVRTGQKTGFYLDQRDNRALLSHYSQGREVLNCFSYTGGFGLWALKGGAAHVTNIDVSAEALVLAQRAAELNGFSTDRIENVVGDVFQTLRTYRDSRRTFDLIVLDPPKFAASANQVTQAARGYKDINLLALKLLRPEGILFTFSCSGHVKMDLFQKIVSDAALDADREVQIMQYLSQAPDHPVSLSFPEGRYLKGLACRVI